MKLEQKTGTIYVFYGDREPQFVWEGGPAKVLHLSREEALHAYKFTLDQDYLVITQDAVWEEGEKLQVCGSTAGTVKTFPEMNLSGFVKTGQEGIFTVYERENKPEKTSEIKLMQSKEDEERNLV